MPGWQKVSGHGEKKLAFCRSLCYYSRALKSTQPISGCGADGSALEWGSRGRWFKSSHSDHVGTDFTLFRRLFMPAAKKDVIHSVTFVPPLKSEAGGFGFVFSRRFEAGSDKIMRAANSPEIVGFQDSFFAFCLKPAPESHMGYLCRAKKVCSTFQAIYDTYLIEERR